MRLAFRRPLPCLLFIASVISVPPSTAALPTTSRELFQIRVKAGKVSVTLVPALRRAIAQHYPGFSFPVREFEERMVYEVKEGRSVREATRFICSGDFDGNGRLDVALYLVQPRRRSRHRIVRRRWYFVAFHQTRAGTFRPYILDRRTDPEHWMNEYTEMLNRVQDNSIDREPRGSRLTFYLPRGEEIGTIRLRFDGISELSADGEVEEVFYFRRGRYRRVNIAGEE